MPASSIRPVTAARQHPSLRGPGSVRAEGGHVVGGRALAGSDEVAYGVSRREGPLPPSFRHPTREAGFSTRQTRRCSAMHESCGFEGLQTPHIRASRVTTNCRAGVGSTCWPTRQTREKAI